MNSGPESRRLVLLGLGANIGDPVAQLGEATRRLAEELGPLTESAVYRTEPVGEPNQPWFYNLVCAARHDIEPLDLLARVEHIEAGLGRHREMPNGPRRIDIDILAMGKMVLALPHLILPHPRMSQRRFVLEPLAEIAPDWRHPLDNRTAGELLSRLGDPSRVERLAPLAELRAQKESHDPAR